jgi:hypothetical protein
MAPEGPDRVRSVEVGEAKDVDAFGAGRRRKGLETSPESRLISSKVTGRQSPDNGPDRKRETDHDRRQNEKDLPPVRFDRRWSRCGDRVLEPIERLHARRLGLPSPR